MKADEQFYKVEKKLAARRNLRPAAKIIYGILRYRTGRNGDCWPGIQRLADDAGISPRTTIRAIEQLEKAGLIAVERNQRVNHYRLLATGDKMASVGHGTGDKMASGQVTKSHPKRVSEKTTARRCAPPDPRVAEFIPWFAEAFKASVGIEYIVQGAKDGNLVKSLLRKLDNTKGVKDSLKELKRLAKNMLNDESFGRPGASIGFLSSQINRWRRGDKQKPPRAKGEYNPAPTTTDYGSDQLVTKF